MKMFSCSIMAFVLYVILGSFGLVHAQVDGDLGGPAQGAGDVEIDDATYQLTGTGAGTTYTVTGTGTFTITAHAALSGSTYTVAGPGGVYAGGMSYTYLRTTNGFDIYQWTSMVYNVPSGMYTQNASVTFTPVGAMNTTTITGTGPSFTLP